MTLRTNFPSRVAAKPRNPGRRDPYPAPELPGCATDPRASGGVDIRNPSVAPPVEPSRFVLVILDGLGDRPHPDTGNLSPVVAAKTPNLDAHVARDVLSLPMHPYLSPRDQDRVVDALRRSQPVRPVEVATDVKLIEAEKA